MLWSLKLDPFSWESNILTTRALWLPLINILHPREIDRHTKTFSCGCVSSIFVVFLLPTCIPMALFVSTCHPSHSCYNECREGRCSGSPRFECECSLGWTSDPATLVLSGVECDVDCGCNFHSTCITAPGICDQCQGESSATRPPVDARGRPGAYLCVVQGGVGRSILCIACPHVSYRKESEQVEWHRHGKM